jgi:hypothetical protein
MNSQLQDQILTNISKQMQEELDQRILWGLLEEEGWILFETPRFIDNYHAIDIGHWLADNCQGEYKRNGRSFLFKESRDATLFILRWGS